MLAVGEIGAGICPKVAVGEGAGVDGATLEAPYGQIDGFLSQLPYKCIRNPNAFVGD